MKKVLIVLGILALMAGPVFADETIKTTSPMKDTWSEHYHEYIDADTDTDTDTDSRKGDELGVGYNLKLVETKSPFVEKVTAEYKFDFNSENHSGYLVAEGSLSGIIEKIKGLFNKE